VDEHYPLGPPGYPDGVLSIIGTCKIVVQVPTKEPQTLTFLVVASNIDYEIQLFIFDYETLGLDEDSFFPKRPQRWPGTPTLYRPAVENPTTKELKLENTPVHWSLPSRKGPPVAAGITPVGDPPPMSDWLIADDAEASMQAKGWINNGMAPWPRRAPRPHALPAPDPKTAKAGRWPPDIPLDSTSPRHCWNCMEGIPWHPGMTWADHKAECAGALLGGHEAASPASNQCYWCARAVENCACELFNPAHEVMDEGVDFSCDVMRFCDW
jgi:hypothetical protein